MVPVERKITWFRRDDDSFVGDATLKDISLDELHRVFRNASNDPQMVLCYPITERELPHIQPHVDQTIRLDLYDYFVEADAVPVPEPAVSE